MVYWHTHEINEWESVKTFVKVHVGSSAHSWGATQPLFTEQEKMSKRIVWDGWRRVRWRWGQQFGVVHSLSVLGINMDWWFPVLCAPSGAGRLKVSCSFSYRSGIRNQQSNTQLSQEERGKDWLHFYGNWTLQPFVLTMKPCLPGSVPEGPGDGGRYPEKKDLG